MTDPRPLPDADLLVWAVISEFRAEQQRDGITILLLPYPPCPSCGETVLHVEAWRAFERDLDSRWIIMQPCEHAYTATDAGIQRIQSHTDGMLAEMKAAANSRVPGVRSWTTDQVTQQAEARLGSRTSESAEEQAR